MRSVVIVGTRHSIQRDLSQSDFSSYINGLISKYDIKAIAEEIDKVESIPYRSSQDHNLEYVNIEPTPDELKNLKIPTVNQVRLYIFTLFDDEASEEAQNELQNRIEETYRARELEWLRRIDRIQKDHILVVCGANHVDPFSELLEKNSYSVIKACSLWE